MRLTIISVCLFGLLYCGHGLVHGGETDSLSALEFPADKAEVVVDLHRAEALLLVPVRINGRDAGLFILDTGASHLQIDRTVVQELGLPQVSRGTVRGVGGTLDMEVHALESITVGEVTLHRSFIGAFDMSKVHLETGTDQIAGILGNEFLRHVAFTVNHREAELVLYDPSEFDPPAEDSAHPIRLLDSKPAVTVSLEQEAIAWFILDTGYDGEISLDACYSRLQQHWLDVRPWNRRQVAGIVGVHDQRESRLEYAELLGKEVDGVVLNYSGESGGLPSGPAAGTVGMALLHDSRITFDYGRGRVWVKHYSEAIPAEWESSDFDPNTADVTGMTSLMRAAKLDQIDYLQRFLGAGVDVNAQNGKGETALYYTALGGNPEATQHLIAAGADVNLVSRESATPLMIAAMYDAPEVVAMLLEADAELEALDMYGRTALVIAAERGNTRVVDALLEAGAKVDVVSRSSGSALNAAAFNGHHEIVESLLEAGADPQARHAPDGTPLLFVAALGGSVEVVAALLDHAVRVDRRNHEGQTALFAAAVRGQADIVELLLRGGVDPDVRDLNGRTAFDYAANGGHFEVMSLLFRKTDRE
jgi:ankyrin repeat protein/predicted aspartyl protease